MGYRVLRYDLVTPVEGFQLLEDGQYPTALHILAMPAVTTGDIELAIGQGERFPIFPGLVIDFCPPGSDGLRLWNANSLPAELVALVWFEGGSSTGPA